MPQDSLIDSILEKYQTKDPAHALRLIAAGSTANGKVKPEELQPFLLALISPEIINKQGPTTGRTALHVAVFYGQAWAVKILLEKNASFEIKDNDNKTAVCLAAENKNREVRRLMFTELANKVTAKIISQYKLVEAEEKNRIEGEAFDSLYKTISEQRGNAGLIIEFLINAIVFTELANKPTPSKEENLRYNQTKHHLKNFIKLLVSYELWKETKKQLTMNFCGLMCMHMFFELMQFPAIFNGDLYISLVNFENDKGNHQVIMINEKPSSVSQETVLCNIMRGEVFTGDEATRYLNTASGMKIEIADDNQHPDFNHFLSAKHKVQELLAQIKIDFLAVYQGQNCDGRLYKRLLSRVREIIQNNPHISNTVFTTLQRSFAFNVKDRINAILDKEVPAKKPEPFPMPSSLRQGI